MSSGTVLNIFVPLPTPRNGITPHNIIKLPNASDAELLLAYDDTAVSVDSFGDVIHDTKMHWSESPTSIGACRQRWL